MYFRELIKGHHSISSEALTSPEICQNFITKPNPDLLKPPFLNV